MTNETGSMTGHPTPYASGGKNPSKSAGFGKSMKGNMGKGKPSTAMGKSKGMSGTGNMGKDCK